MVVTAGLFAWLLARAPNKRRFAAIDVGFWTLLALVSGFLILYTKPTLKATGWKDWAKFWHVAWSWWSLWAAGAHTWINRHGALRALRHWQTRALAWRYNGTLLLVLLAIPLTWSSWGARNIVEANYIALTLWTALVVVGVSYATWWYYVARRQAGAVPAMFKRPAVQRFVDVYLMPATILANLSGIPLLWFGTKHTSLKYVAKYWHTWPSIIMAVLVFAHMIQFWPGIKRHMHSGGTRRA